jgi:hypothetical protein
MRRLPPTSLQGAGMNLLYVIVALGIAWIVSVGAQQFRIERLQSQVTACRADVTRAKAALVEYQVAASNELIRRISENAATEQRLQKELDDATAAYDHRVADINARWLRSKAQAASHRPRTMSQATGAARARMDAAAQCDRLPRCIREDRRSDFEALLREAEINTAKLIACQEYRSGKP